jgi:serine/threonine protein kinase
MIGTTLVVKDRTFELDAYIGRGSFGHVYRAVHRPTMDYVAVKVLPNNASPDSNKALRNEIQLSDKVRHPNVVSVLGINLDPEHALGPYIAMEYVDGGTLQKKLNDCRNSGQLIPLDYAGQIMLQIAQGAKAIMNI